MEVAKVKLSHPAKLLFRDAKISKRRLANYYERVAAKLIPHLSDRPLTLRQFPQGVSKPGFFRKHAPDYFPTYVKRLQVPRADPSLDPLLMVSVDEPADLKYFASQNVIELHMTTARSPGLRVPDQLVFDLDPSDGDFDKVRFLARALKKMLDAHNIPSFIKLSGSRGVHVHVPIKAELPYAILKPWTLKVARQLVVQSPEIATVEHLIANRGDRVYIDVLRNDYAQTIVAPYSVRAFATAPIAAPIDWHDVERKSLVADKFDLTNIDRRMRARSDPWQGFFEKSISARNFPWL